MPLMIVPMARLFLITVAAATTGGVAGCSNQARAYSANPICHEARQKCEVYHRTVQRMKTDQGAGMDLLREDCEASQRACAEGVSRSLETSYPEEPGRRKTSYWDY